MKKPRKKQWRGYVLVDRDGQIRLFAYSRRVAVARFLTKSWGIILTEGDYQRAEMKMRRDGWSLFRAAMTVDATEEVKPR